MKRFICFGACLFVMGFVVATAHAEDVHWISGPGNNTLIPTNYGTASTPLSWFDTTKWFTDAAHPQSSPNGAIPVDAQSVGHTNSCCNPEPFVDINNGGAGVFLPNSAIRFDAKTNLFDTSAGDLGALPGSYNLAAVDDALTAASIEFNGAGGAANDVYVPVIAPFVTSNRHGAVFNVSPTLTTLTAGGGHQNKWRFNASPTAPLTLIELVSTDGRGSDFDDTFHVDADVATATMNHVWSQVKVYAGDTLTAGVYNLTMDAGWANPNRFTLDGDIVVTGQFNIEGIDQGTGTWGATGSGADTEVAWITGSGLLTVGGAPPPPPAAPQILFIGAAGGPTSGADGGVMTFLEGRYGAANVEYRQASTVSAGDELAFDALVISSTISSGDGRNKFQNSTVGVLNWEEALVDDDAGEFQMSIVNKPGGQTHIDMVDNAHYITEGFPLGPLEIFTAGSETVAQNGLIAGGVDVLANEAGTADATLFLADTGAALFGDGSAGRPDTAFGRRALFPITDNGFDNLNADGLELFGRTVDWIAGADVAAIPEPGSFVLAGFAALGVALLGRRRRKRSK